jgi:hypothetical protein
MRRCGARLLRAALLSCLAVLALGGDYYNTLGIARGADEATIKRNYHKLALCAPARRCARLGALCSERGGACWRCRDARSVLTRGCLARAADAQEVAPRQEPDEQGGGRGQVPRGATQK